MDHGCWRAVLGGGVEECLECRRIIVQCPAEQRLTGGIDRGEVTWCSVLLTSTPTRTSTSAGSVLTSPACPRPGRGIGSSRSWGEAAVVHLTNERSMHARFPISDLRGV